MVKEREKHILFVSSWYPSRIDKFNGDFVFRHAKAISLLNRVSVVHVEGDYEISQWELVKKTINEQFTEYIFYFPKSRFSIVNFVKKIIGLKKGLKILGKIDLIHANVVHYQFVWLLTQGIPYIITEHASQYHRLSELPNSLFKKLIFKPIFRKAKMVLPVSTQLGFRLEEIFGKLKIKVIPNVVDTKIFYPTETEHESINFLHVSNLGEAKNIKGILEVILRLSEKGYRFIFQIGGNGDTSFLHDFINIQQLNHIIKVLPALSQSEVSNLMRQSDCFVLFSDYENQPCVIAESMACGLPFIATNVGGISEFLPPEGYLLVEKNNLDQLQEAMISIIEQRQIYNKQRIAEYARKTFSNLHISQKINKIYNDCLNDS